MSQLLRNYEIVSVADRARLLITTDREEIQGEWPAHIQGARLEHGALILACQGEDGRAYELSLVDFPEQEGAKLSAYQASLCGIENGRVVYAHAIPRLQAVPTPIRRGP